MLCLDRVIVLTVLLSSSTAFNSPVQFEFSCSKTPFIVFYLQFRLCEFYNYYFVMDIAYNTAAPEADQVTPAL